MTKQREIARKIRNFTEIGYLCNEMHLLYYDDIYQIFEVSGMLKVFRNGFEQANFCPKMTIYDFEWVKSEVLMSIDEEQEERDEMNSGYNYYGLNHDEDL